MWPTPAAERQATATAESLTGSPGLASVAVLIPAWDPDHRLLEVLGELVRHGVGHIVVIDDGSSSSCEPIFKSAAAMNGVEVVRHAVNLGKGRALKTGLKHILTATPALRGVVTADADGQHTPGDILRVAEALLVSGPRPVLGVRGFSGDIPFRSRAGNLLTRHVFGLLTGRSIHDTQTGLRGLPRVVLRSLLTLEGERYEYEMTVLAYLCRSGPAPIEVPIATVYLEGNRGSHFDPVWDSMRIYFVLLRFYLSSLLAAGLDLAVFSLCFVLTHNLLLSVLVGRFSSLVNFAINRGFVFHSHSSASGALGRYYTLAAAIAAGSYGLILMLTGYAHWNMFAAKVFVDALLSPMSFSAQRALVFRREDVG